MYNAINSDAFSSRSGGIEGRPTALYISSNTGESPSSAASASAFTARSGCFSGTRRSGERRLNIVACFVSAPRMRHLSHATDQNSLSITSWGFSAAC